MTEPIPTPPEPIPIPTPPAPPIPTPPAPDPAKSPEPAPGAPEKYTDFKLPENVTVNQDLLGKFNEVAKGLNLPQENAQKLMDLAAEHGTAVVAEQKAQWDTIRDGWVTEIKADKDFGGDKFNETIERAKRALKTNDPENTMKDFLETTGFGDFPPLIRMLANMDKRYGEDKTVDGGPAKPDNRTAAQRIYGS